MKLRFMDMIDLYIEAEKKRMAKEAEAFKRGILETFAFHLDRRFDRGAWSITDITDEDGKSFYRFLKQYEMTPSRTRKKIEVVNHFMHFAKKKGWIERRPWKNLPSRKRGDVHFSLDEKLRHVLIHYLETLSAAGFIPLRDRAMLMLLLGYRLGATEVSKIDLDDYDGAVVRVNSPFKWRERECRLSDVEKAALDAYIFEREKKLGSSYETALFVGVRKRRIDPKMVRETLAVYAGKAGEA